MPIGNPFELGKLVDLSAEINIIPNTWGILQQLGIFQNEYKTQRTVLVPRTTETVTVLEDRNWNERNQTIAGGARDVLPIAIPHFPADDMILPTDLQGVVSWDSLLSGGNAAETLANIRARKMESLRNTHALTLEVARMQLIKDGSVYAPNGTVITNFYSEFSTSRQTDKLDLASTTDDPMSAIEDARGAIQDEISNGQIVTNFVALCSTSFFNALIKNPFVMESFRYYSQPQGGEILNQRLGSGFGLDARYRVFEYAGVSFIEVRGNVNGVSYVEDGKAYLFPLGTDSFRTYFAPAERFDEVNTTAQESYYFEFPSQKMDKIEIETETNFVNALLRPDVVRTLDKDAV